MSLLRLRLAKSMPLALPILLRDSPRLTAVVSVLSFLLLDTSLQTARCLVSMVPLVVEWSIRATGKWGTLPTILTPRIRAVPSTSNVSKLQNEKKKTSVYHSISRHLCFSLRTATPTPPTFGSLDFTYTPFCFGPLLSTPTLITRTGWLIIWPPAMILQRLNRPATRNNSIIRLLRRGTQTASLHCFASFVWSFNHDIPLPDLCRLGTSDPHPYPFPLKSSFLDDTNLFRL